ncbi:MAG: 3-phosphoshikimate 1-carboxyvinyltransferase [Christensenellaceae bacterium]
MNYAVKRFAPEGKPLCVSVPGSKSITNRALLLSVLSDGECTLTGVQTSEDAAAFLSCVQELGYDVTLEGDTCRVVGGEIKRKDAVLNVRSAGTAARFLTAYLGLSEGSYTLDASEQMRRRPMKPLLDSLAFLGAEREYLGEEGQFPFRISGHPQGGEVTIDVEKSSQFLSALLISAPAAGGLTIRTIGKHGMAYVEMTLAMMKQFGIDVRREGNAFVVPGGRYRARAYEIEPDVSAACYFYALAALTRRTVSVRGVYLPSLQGDVRFLDVLERMGARVDRSGEVSVTGTGVLHGVTADMSSFSDQAITLAAIASFADSPTTITGIGHIRLQESDRIRAICTEIRKLGGRAEAGEDFLKIYPAALHGGSVATYDDHRMAMGFSLVGTQVDGVVIEHAECCKKTFAEYFDVLDAAWENS